MICRDKRRERLVCVKKEQDFNFRKDIIDVKHSPFLSIVTIYIDQKGGTSFRQKKRGRTIIGIKEVIKEFNQKLGV